MITIQMRGRPGLFLSSEAKQYFESRTIPLNHIKIVFCFSKWML
jgi:hypothetical protein